MAFKLQITKTMFTGLACRNTHTVSFSLVSVCLWPLSGHGLPGYIPVFNLKHCKERKRCSPKYVRMCLFCMYENVKCVNST